MNYNPIPQRNMLLWVFATLCFQGLFGSTQKGTNPEHILPTQISLVTLFLDGAEINRTASLTCPEGYNTLIFRGITTQINLQSLRIALPNAHIISMEHRHMDRNTEPTHPGILALFDSLNHYQHLLEINQIHRQVITVQEGILNKNQQIATNPAAQGAESLKQLLELNKTKRLELGLESMKRTAEKGAYEKRIQEINQEIAKIKEGIETAPGEIRVAIFCSKPLKNQTLSISYATQRASWTPVYDLMAASESDEGKLVYKASMSQFTGELWNAVPIHLSSASPSYTQQLPVFRPELIGFENKIPKNKMVRSRLAEAYYEDSEPATHALSKESTAVFYTDRMFFEISLQQPQTLPKSGSKQTALLKEIVLPIGLEYNGFPKQGSEVWVTGKAVIKPEYAMLPGSVQLYLDQTFCGQSYIQSGSFTDTAEVPFGVDPKLKLTREPILEFSSKSFWGSQIKESYKFRVQLLNNHNRKIQVTITDQIPLSTHSDIKIEPQLGERSSYDAETGKVVWTWKIEPGKRESEEIGYQISYPKDKKLNRYSASHFAH